MENHSDKYIPNQKLIRAMHFQTHATLVSCNSGVRVCMGSVAAASNLVSAAPHVDMLIYFSTNQLCHRCDLSSRYILPPPVDDVRMAATTVADAENAYRCSAACGWRTQSQAAAAVRTLLWPLAKQRCTGCTDSRTSEAAVDEPRSLSSTMQALHQAGVHLPEHVEVGRAMTHKCP